MYLYTHNTFITNCNGIEILFEGQYEAISSVCTIEK